MEFLVLQNFWTQSEFQLFIKFGKNVFWVNCIIFSRTEFSWKAKKWSIEFFLNNIVFCSWIWGVKQKLILPWAIEIQGIWQNNLKWRTFTALKTLCACCHLVVWRHGLLEHVPDQVVCLLGDETVHPPQGGPGPVSEVHRHNRDLRAVILPELGLETLPQRKIYLKIFKNI